MSGDTLVKLQKILNLCMRTVEQFVAIGILIIFWQKHGGKAIRGKIYCAQNTQLDITKLNLVESQ